MTQKKTKKTSSTGKTKKAPAGASATDLGLSRVRKVELIQRTLGLRHKLKVHDSMESPETHEDLAVMLMSKWELEDELQAIEEVLSEARRESLEEKKDLIMQGVLGKAKKKPLPLRKSNGRSVRR